MCWIKGAIRLPYMELLDYYEKVSLNRDVINDARLTVRDDFFFFFYGYGIDEGKVPVDAYFYMYGRVNGMKI